MGVPILPDVGCGRSQRIPMCVGMEDVRPQFRESLSRPFYEMSTGPQVGVRRCVTQPEAGENGYVASIAP